MSTYNKWLMDTTHDLITEDSDVKHILNLGSGKRHPVDKVDIKEKGKSDSYHAANIVNADFVTFAINSDDAINPLTQFSSNLDNILSFMEGCGDEIFDDIISCRYFEHIPWGELDYYLYQMYRITKDGGSLSFVVPDFNKLGEALKELDENFDYQKWITLNTEYFNEKSDPHSCLWTTQISSRLLEGEGFWKDTTVEPITIDGRHWYIKVTTHKKPECMFEKGK